MGQFLRRLVERIERSELFFITLYVLTAIFIIQMGVKIFLM